VAQILDGRALAETIRAELVERIARLQARGITPGLAAIVVGENPSSLSYVRSKTELAANTGLFSETLHLPESTTEAELIAVVHRLNVDPRYHGILVQLPLPSHISEAAVSEAIAVEKDADGMTVASAGRLLRGERCFFPATPAGVQQLLIRNGYDPAGRHVVVVGRSNIVGKPLAVMLSQKAPGANATVTLCHTGTPDLAEHTRRADILIAAMGRAHAITADMVREGVVVVDVGNNWIADPTRKSGRRLVGDVDFEAVALKAEAITPVPGGVGPMTVTMLIANTVQAAEWALEG
jgi:methylenetetrahydrofolate dehydrogenase (NADP+)/methenyltetrahydrofolate cyclohydrolase